MIDERGHFYNGNALKKDTIPSFDTSAFYFHKFIYFNRLMDKAHGRAFARFEDSCMRYKKLLDRLKR